MDDDHHIRLTDRAKDVIKSGGEWISSIDVENLTVSCPGVADAALIGIPHPQWEERPLLLIVPRCIQPRHGSVYIRFSPRQDCEMVASR
ncbi:hypothetical protein [Bradyrhizobium sp. STM 3843]|uniref:AMP-binding enzyme n=1 Tax=Bradyrhizobium sp. STM 3843 TaxID=551947 RepID=UPI001FCC5000|nr:hypothetical protein [Bradyrhizobium sp. STM 3843]